MATDLYARLLANQAGQTVAPGPPIGTVPIAVEQPWRSWATSPGSAPMPQHIIAENPVAVPDPESIDEKIKAWKAYQTMTPEQQAANWPGGPGTAGKFEFPIAATDRAVRSRPPFEFAATKSVRQFQLDPNSMLAYQLMAQQLMAPQAQKMVAANDTAAVAIRQVMANTGLSGAAADILNAYMPAAQAAAQQAASGYQLAAQLAPYMAQQKMLSQLDREKALAAYQSQLDEQRQVAVAQATAAANADAKNAATQAFLDAAAQGNLAKAAPTGG